MQPAAQPMDDREALSALYNHYKSPVLSYVHGMVGRRSAAEEIVGEIFIRLYRQRELAPAKFTLWLWTLVRQTTQELAPHDEPLRPDWELQPMDEHSEASTSPETERVAMDQAPRKAVEESLRTLSVSQRDALLLRTFAQLPSEEIAEISGIPLKTVRSLLVRAEAGLIGGLKGKNHGR